jgi:hypothetical protein
MNEFLNIKATVVYMLLPNSQVKYSNTMVRINKSQISSIIESTIDTGSSVIKMVNGDYFTVVTSDIKLGE